MVSIAVVGAGAVGSYYGGLLARAGLPVVLIGRAAHVEAIRSRGLRILQDGHTMTVPVAATTELDAARGAQLVLLCVKSRDTAATCRSLRPLLDPDTIVMSLQNGVANPSVIAGELEAQVVPTVVYVATALAEPGVVAHHGGGRLAIGSMPQSLLPRERIEALAQLLRGAGITVDVADRVMDALWGKLMVNCAYNALSAITQLDYATLVGSDEIRELMRALVAEVVAVGRAQGVRFPEDVEAPTWAIAQSMPRQRSSTAQDLARGRPTEIDWINGQIVRDGALQGIPTPANQAVHALVRLLEAAGRVAVPIESGAGDRV
jgi:2-dehydropantoate 2-reductase